MTHEHITCPKCAAPYVNGHGAQVVKLTETYDDNGLDDWEADDWDTKLGTWTWDCDECKHTWTTQEGPAIPGETEEDPDGQ